MFERFTSEAKASVVAAQDICIARGDGMIGSEHLLVAAARASHPILTTVGLEAAALEEAWNRLEADALATVGVDAEPEPPWRPRWKGRRHIPFSGSAKAVLKGALQETLERGDRYIGVEHLLLALTVQPPQDRAIRVLERSGSPASELRSTLHAALRKVS